MYSFRNTLDRKMLEIYEGLESTREYRETTNEYDSNAKGNEPARALATNRYSCTVT
jgi:hypothetical protein